MVRIFGLEILASWVVSYEAAPLEEGMNLSSPEPNANRYCCASRTSKNEPPIYLCTMYSVHTT